MFTLENGKMINDKVKEYKLMKMVMSMMVNGTKIIDIIKVNSFIKMAIHI